MPHPCKSKVVFADAFAGCGGLSLGLLQAGLKGCFAIEHDKFAFATFASNLLANESPVKFDWPGWLPKTPLSIAANRASRVSGGSSRPSPPPPYPRCIGLAYIS